MINGTPVNTKSLLAFVFNQMERLAAHEITDQEACAQAKLASQASNLLNYELKRTIVQMRMQQIGTGLQATDIHLREIESKGFSNTMSYSDVATEEVLEE